MDTIELLTLLLSSTVLSTFITTIINSFASRKKDALENITKERKIWRNEMRAISEEIIKSKNYNDLRICVNKLKVRINTYGIISDSPFNESHVWKEIRNFEKSKNVSEIDLEKHKRIFIEQISCLLKLDWDRSKGEIKGNVQTRLVICSLAVGFVFYSINYFLNNSINNDIIIDYLYFCIIYFLLVLLSLFMINMADKWKTKNELKIYIFIGIVAFFMISGLFFNLASNFFPKTTFEFVLLAIPVLTLLYSCEIKILIYRRNVGKFLLTSLIVTNKTEADENWEVFLPKDYKKKLQEKLPPKKQKIIVKTQMINQEKHNCYKVLICKSVTCNRE